MRDIYWWWSVTCCFVSLYGWLHLSYELSIQSCRERGKFELPLPPRVNKPWVDEAGRQAYLQRIHIPIVSLRNWSFTVQRFSQFASRILYNPYPALSLIIKSYFWFLCISWTHQVTWSHSAWPVWIKMFLLILYKGNWPYLHDEGRKTVVQC